MSTTRSHLSPPPRKTLFIIRALRGGTLPKPFPGFAAKFYTAARLRHAKFMFLVAFIEVEIGCNILHILCDEVNVFRVDRCLRWNEKVQNLRIRIIVIRCSEKNRSFAFLFIEFLRVFIYIYILRENIQSTFFQHQRYVEATSRIVKQRGRVACSSGEQNRSRNHESERRSPSNR